MARFVPFVRTFAPFAAGIGKMNYNRFFIYDLFGGFLWVFSLTIAGYLLGEVEWIRKTHRFSLPRNYIYICFTNAY